MASSGTLAGLAIAAASLIGELDKEPHSNPLFLPSIIVAVVAFVVFMLAWLSGLADWAAGPLQKLRWPQRLVTSRWRYTTDGGLPVLRLVSQAVNVNLPGSNFMQSQENRPPWVRFVVMTACTAVHPDVDEDELRQRFEEFLGSSPVMALVRSLTYVHEGDRWFRWAGRGSGLDAVLAPAEGADGVAARLVLPYAVSSDWRDRKYAVMILHIEPRDQADEPADPRLPKAWRERIEAALELPQALADFLTRELGRRVTGEPQAVLGVRMEAIDLTALIDITGRHPLPGGIRGSEVWCYFIGESDGAPAGEAATKMIRDTLRYALAVQS